jgi:hypothetical protein
MASNELQAVFVSNVTNPEVGYFDPHNTETRIGYTAYWV